MESNTFYGDFMAQLIWRLFGNLIYHVSSIGLFHFLSVQGDGRKIPGLVKSMNFQRSTTKSPKIPGGWQHFANKIHRN